MDTFAPIGPAFSLGWFFLFAKECQPEVLAFCDLHGSQELWPGCVCVCLCVCACVCVWGHYSKGCLCRNSAPSQCIQVWKAAAGLVLDERGNLQVPNESSVLQKCADSGGHQFSLWLHALVHLEDVGWLSGSPSSGWQTKPYFTVSIPLLNRVFGCL